MRQITVLHGPERRRRWTDEERLRILAEAAALGRVHALPHRRSDLPDQQRRRTGAVLCASRPKAWLFCGSDRGGLRAAIVYSLIQTCRLNDVDPQAWLADVLARIAECPVSKLGELLPWNWHAQK